MSQFPSAEFYELLSDYPRLKRQSLELGSGSMPARLAIVGFSLSAAKESWTENHLDFIRTRCEGELSDAELAFHGDSANAWRCFACLALGYLLGLYQSGRIDEAQFNYADAVLPGFMYLKSPQIHLLEAE